MRTRSLLFLVALLALLAPLPALADGTGSVSGTVVNGTAGGGPVGGLTVKLTRYQGMNVLQEYTATTTDDGSYQFTNLPINQGEAYVAEVTYHDVTYHSDMIDLTKSAQAKADIKVYETTTDPNAVSMSSRSVVIAGAEPETGLLDIFEIVIVENKGDRSYLGNNNEVLRLSLPANAQQITPQPGFDFGQPRLDNGDLVTTGAIPPGEQTALLSYTVPYKGTKTSFSIRTAMPTQTFRVLVKENTYHISSPALANAGTVQISEDSYDLLSADRPVVGDTITVQVWGLPRQGGGVAPSTLIASALAVVVALALAGLLVYQTIRRRRAGVPALATAAGPDVSGDASDAPAGDLDDERLALAAELNDLDEARAAGSIDEATYESKRQQLIERLRGLSLRMRGLEDAEV